MRILIPIAAFALLSACTDAPVAKKAPEKPLEPLTGRAAFYQTYPPARTWAADAQPVRVRSLDLTEMPAIGAKAAAWEVTYFSQSRGKSRVYTWSAIEASGDIHKGVFGTREEASQSGSADKPFLIQALKIDTPEALETAIAHSDTFFKGGGVKPHPKFELEYTAQHPNPVWRIYWGDSVATANWSVFVDASTGQYQGR